MKFWSLSFICVFMFCMAVSAGKTVTLSPRGMTVKANEAGKIEIINANSEKICEYEFEELSEINSVVAMALQRECNIVIDLETRSISLAPMVVEKELSPLDKIIKFLEPHGGFFPLGFHTGSK